MPLQLNVSNSLHDLAEQLAIQLKQEAADVFQQQFLVTQTDGMNNWLTIQLATKLGISANCRFVKPNDIVNQLYYWLGADQGQVLGADHLQWLLYNLMAAPEFMQQFPTIAGYYHDDDVKRIALAQKVADLFDQYQVYRPEMVAEWNRILPGQEPGKDWQQYLWVKVREKTGNSLTDKTSVIHQIIQQLQIPAQQQRLYARMPHLHIFGVSIITQLHIHLFNELSKYCSVSFYLLNPAPQVYWLDDKTEKQIARLGQLQKSAGKPTAGMVGSGNALLISWGKVIQETFGLLFENDSFLNVYNDAGVTQPGTGGTATLLQKIQQDIFFNRDATERNQLTVTDICDHSFTINACYTPVREVEVLYNYLVYLTDQLKEQLSPRDIVVMVSDIDVYAPYIKAVFETARYRFPITIADESVQSGDGIFAAIEAVLSVSADSFKAEEVMQLLDAGYIRNRFGITDIALIRQVVGQANIRFGIEGSKEDDTVLVSWNTGMQRIMYGICMSGSTEYAVGQDSIYPLDVAEGTDALELVRFNHFIEVLKWYVQERENKRTLAEWGRYIQQLADNLVFQPDTNETEEDYQRLLQYIENLNLLTATFNEPVSYEVFKHSFLGIIGMATRSGSFASGGITFCSLIPMRSIPFKVVALLGMDFDKFPRRETPLSFNLMEQKRRKGDRNVKDNDKHLFLETILSAQQYLYISYIGRNAKDNSIHPPSALVDELVDYVESGITGSSVQVRELLVTTQPLHGFSQQYFKPGSRLYSYLGEDAAAYSGDAAIKHALPEKTTKLFDWDEIPVASLLSFFKNPFKWYYNKVLGIYYNEEDVLLPDTEIFELDNLQKWKLKNDLLQLNESGMDDYRTRAVKTGTLPLKHMAEIEVVNTLESIAPVIPLLKSATGEQPASEVFIAISLQDSVISGKLGGVYGDVMLVISFSGNHYKYLLEAYLRYLLVTAGGMVMDVKYLSGHEESIFTIPKHTFSQSFALERLQQLLGFFKNGHAGIFPFYPGWKENPFKIAGFDGVKFNKQLGAFLGRNPDEYLQKEVDNGLFLTQSPVDQFLENTIAIFSPVAQLFPELIPSIKS